MVLLVMKTVATVPTMMYVSKPSVHVQMDVLLDMKGKHAKKVCYIISVMVSSPILNDKPKIH